MRKPTLLALALLCVTAPACSRSPAEPVVPGTLEVLVSWQGQGVPDRQLEILELGLVKMTDARGIAVFELQPGRYTLRAHVNGPGPPIPTDRPVVVHAAEKLKVVVADCLPCV